MTYRSLTLTVEGAVAVVRRTAGDGFLPELSRVALDVADNDSVHVLLLTADPGASAIDSEADGAKALLQLEQMPQPVLACVESDIRDADLELLLACDIRIAGAAATFASTQVARGEVPSLGGTQRLPRLVGRARATAMILLGDVLDAQEALGCGLVSEVTGAGGTEARGREIAAAIAAQGPLAVRYAKEAIRQGLDMPLEQALRYETDLTVILQTTDDRGEGVRAFLEKRPPKFEGR